MFQNVTNALTGAVYQMQSWTDESAGNVRMSGFCKNGIMSFFYDTCKSGVDIICGRDGDYEIFKPEGDEICTTLHARFETLVEPTIQDTVKDAVQNVADSNWISDDMQKGINLAMVAVTVTAFVGAYWYSLYRNSANESAGADADTNADKGMKCKA